ncbi:MAG: threonine aldolase [Deltaproteobacteria bacterium SG8_13]|nr:MAG: threonine aldolase [Deltaproteobacteria bacterium SG8_13]
MFERMIDLRSDTVTQPTQAMRHAMASAEVGDDVFGEDPTINRLEEIAAETLGKEAGLFVTSGTMANLVSELAHCGRGEEMILGDQAHSFFYEQGGAAAVGSIHPRTLPNRPDGSLALAEIEAAVRPDNIHFPRTRLIMLENTHNRCSGAPLPAEYLQSVRELADAHGLKIHIDGARLFNAAAALKVPAAELAAPADSVSICLSKGLAAPVGSVVCGTHSFIEQARRARKLLGGGMRQAGVIAAAGIVALTEMTQRLAEDHANAHDLAQGLARIDGISLDPQQIHTNIVYFRIVRKDLPAEQLSGRLVEKGVRLLAAGPGLCRAVTHYQITAEDITAAVKAVEEIMNS